MFLSSHVFIQAKSIRECSQPEKSTQVHMMAECRPNAGVNAKHEQETSNIITLNMTQISMTKSDAVEMRRMIRDSLASKASNLPQEPG